MVGVDDAPALRACDLSIAGLAFSMEKTVGEIDSIQRLRLRAPDAKTPGGAEPVEIMARLVRCAAEEAEAELQEVAFEFLPESPQKREALRYLLTELVTSLDPSAVQTSDLPSAAVFQLAIHELKITTSWPVPADEVVQVVFKSAGTDSKIPFEGKVIRSEMLAPNRHEHEVQMQHVGARAGAAQPSTEISESVDLLFQSLLDNKTSGGHLVGTLSRIQLPSMLSLLNMEQSTGALHLKHQDQYILLHLKQGDIIDATDMQNPEADRPPRTLISIALAWSEGTFNFVESPVDREDRLRSSTMALLLDLARESDEEGR